MRAPDISSGAFFAVKTWLVGEVTGTEEVVALGGAGEDLGGGLAALGAAGAG